jgi:hypothetical protein
MAMVPSGPAHTFAETRMKGETLMQHKDLNQLLCAATINVRFRETLLRDPAQAIAAGYFGHTFSLTPEERELVIGIQAQQLEDFAAQVYCWISGNNSGSGHNDHRKNGNGHRQDATPLSDYFVDLSRARVPVPA